MDTSRLTQIEAAALLSVTTRTLRDWEKAGAGIPRNDDGTYPGPALVAWEVSRHRQDGEFDDQRERLAAAQAERVEAENAVRRGQLADVAAVAAVWTDHVAACRARLLSLPSKLSPQLTGINDPNVLAAAIRAEINAALAELSEYELPAEPGDTGDGVAHLASAADADGQPVGRRRTKAQ